MIPKEIKIKEKRQLRICEGFQVLVALILETTPSVVGPVALISAVVVCDDDAALGEQFCLTTRPRSSVRRSDNSAPFVREDVWLRSPRRGSSRAALSTKRVSPVKGTCNKLEHEALTFTQRYSTLNSWKSTPLVSVVTFPAYKTKSRN